ncbi:universal stress protein [Maribacter arcticus]|uniref:universal stress protein n=1 Tax=Maribacter arcticus TaxID=561365 RepID=UPI0030D9D091|tara:strand:- start:455 stop:1294 length:840 start_codon:yes stop_codon:yes gene_type:complete
MKNILIPTDFSENAWNAIVYAISLFKKNECSFYLIHVNPIDPNSGSEGTMFLPPEIFEESILKKSRKKLKLLLEKIQKLPLNTKHTFETKAMYGFFTDYIKQEVIDKKIDLIIMGTKGASGIKAVSLGSNTGNVITKVPCAVLTVPENAKYSDPKEIGFPTDFLLGYDDKVMKRIKELVFLHKSALRFLHVTSKGDQLSMEQIKNREFLKDYFTDTTYSFHTLKEKKLDVAVQHFVESCNLDMIVMVAKNLNFLERILFRPKVEKISYHTSVPFLVIHE